jgi:peptidoglycan/xylan/chitin deacetylase (PgdA/CDA1 family)
LIANKREFLARGMVRLGMIGLLERAARRPGILITTFHRIGDPAAGSYYDGVYAASPAAFRAQVRHLRDRFRLIALDELIALADADFAVDRPTALITFDDGYRDNFDVALPILEELGAVASFFIPTGFFTNPRLPWWDHLAYVLKQTRRPRIELERPGPESEPEPEPEPLVLDLEANGRPAAIAAVVRLYLDGKIADADEPAFRAHLEERAGVAVDESALGRDLFMTWDQVRGLAERGMAIGSHAHDHCNLARLDEAGQRRELSESKRILEHELGREVRALAYPFGWAGTYSSLTEHLAQETGYRLAFSSLEGVNRPGPSPSRRFALHRLGVGYHDSAPLFRARTALQSSFGASFL